MTYFSRMSCTLFKLKFIGRLHRFLDLKRQYILSLKRHYIVSIFQTDILRSDFCSPCIYQGMQKNQNESFHTF